MDRTLRVVVGVVIAVSLIAPLSAYALGTSFGGRIIATVPCVSAFGPALWFTIMPAGFFPVTYIWTAASITKLAGPPRSVGQQVLGVADVPFECFVGHIPFFGQRVQLIGTSPF